MWNKKIRKFAAAALAASVTMAAGVSVLPTAINTIAEEAEEEKEKLSLALGDDAKAAFEENSETETETQKETETETEKIVYETLETTKTDEAAIRAIDVSDIVTNTMPSIVAITGTSIQQVESYFYGRQEIETQGAGSGIIIAQNDTELLIATNNHVVEGTNELTVCFTVDSDDSEKLLAPAVIKGTSAKTDLAVIAVRLADIDPDILPQLKIATMGKSDGLKVGEAAIVIGNALGTGQTVTSGIISALEREITTEAGTFTELQTDAAINLGCSGGAILNSKGEVIAITEAKAVADAADNMGYGIPINTAIPVLTDLINRETRETVENHGYLGITVVPVSDEAMQMYDMPAGAYVYEVNEDSAAQKAGIKKGDIITKVDSLDIDSSDTLVSTLGYYEVGETIKLEVMSNDTGTYAPKEVEVTLQQGPATEKDDENEEKDVQGQSEKYEYNGDDNSYGYNDPFGFDDFGQFFFGDNFGGNNRNYGWDY